MLTLVSLGLSLERIRSTVYECASDGQDSSRDRVVDTIVLSITMTNRSFRTCVSLIIIMVIFIVLECRIPWARYLSRCTLKGCDPAPRRGIWMLRPHRWRASSADAEAVDADQVSYAKGLSSHMRDAETVTVWNKPLY